MPAIEKAMVDHKRKELPMDANITNSIILRTVNPLLDVSYSFHVRQFQPFKYRHHITLPRWVNSLPERLE